MDKIKKAEEKEKISVDRIYTPLSVAREEIWKRWNDKELRKKVEQYLGEIPEPFKAEPRAALSRNIITPNQEFLYFLDLVKDVKLKPVGMEGVNDKFCTKNSDKVSLGKLSFFNNIKKQNNQKRVVNIIDLEKSDGKRFSEIKTLWGEGLVDFHHRMLDINDLKIGLFDDFKWFSERNKKDNPSQYYENLFALFVCHGILFENFHANGKEKEFTDDVIMKNYKKVMEIFDLKPLIIPLVPIEDELYLEHWNGYEL